MESKKFDITKLEKLNHPGRIIDINPTYIWEFIDIQSPQTVADIGAGTGIFAKEFAKLSPSSNIIALDISSTMIDWMNKNICPDFPNITTMLMKESETPLSDNSVDIVIMINLHHELLDEQTLLHESYRILKTGGKIAICDWKKEETPKGPPMEIRLRPEEVAQQLEISKFNSPKISNELINNWLVVAGK